MTMTNNRKSVGVVNIARLLAMREEGLCNDKSTNFQLSRLRCYHHPIVNHREQYFRKKVRHSNYLYANWSYTCKFAECPGAENTLAKSRADGWLTVLNTIGLTDDGGEQLQQIQVEHKSIVDFAWMPNDLKLVSGSADGKLTFWHISSPYTLPGKDFNCHKYAVRTVCFSKHQTSVFASGGQIGEIQMYDCRLGANPIFSIYNAHEEVDDNLYYFDEDLYYQEGKSVTGLAFQNEHTLFSCTFGKRIIKAWDIRHLKPNSSDSSDYKYTLLLHQQQHDDNVFHGFTSLSIDSSGKKLYSRCSNGSIYSYDVSTMDSYFPEAEFKHDDVKSDYTASITTRASLSPNGEHLICSSSTGTAHIWNTAKPGKPVAKLYSQGDMIRSVDWSRASHTKIATYTQRDYVRLWQDEVEVNKRRKM